MVARFQSTPKETHVAAVKRILRYLKGTVDYGLWYQKSNKFTLRAFIEVDWVGSIEDRKITSGATFYLGDCLVSWLRKNSLPFHSLHQKPSILLLHHVVHNSFG